MTWGGGLEKGTEGGSSGVFGWGSMELGCPCQEGKCEGFQRGGDGCSGPGWELQAGVGYPEQTDVYGAMVWGPDVPGRGSGKHWGGNGGSGKEDWGWPVSKGRSMNCLELSWG